VYDWYSSPGVAPFHEFAATKDFKLYREGTFYDLKADPFEEKEPKKESELKDDEAAVASKLRAVLTSYADARPPELQQQSDEINGKKPARIKRQQRRVAKQKAAADKKSNSDAASE
jgi:hypothetical protein